MRTVLLVEDNENNRYLFTLLLTHAGFKVLTAVNGREGLEKARADKPDAILLDIQMGEMDGYEVCRRLKADFATRDEARTAERLLAEEVVPAFAGS